MKTKNVLRLTWVIVASFLICTSSDAQTSEPIELWPDGVPGESKLKLPDEKTDVTKHHGRDEQRIRFVSTPTLTMYLVPKDKNKGTTVLVCPGGGYNMLAYTHEGVDVCKWLNSIGINAGLLKYRVPRRDELAKHAAPLQDVQRAMTMLRNNSAKWNLNSRQVGILGFSAGGHLSAMALTSDGDRTYAAGDVKNEKRSVSCVPDFGVLVYPAYLEDQKDPVALSPELKVTEKTPPTFLVVAHDDSKYVEGSARFYIEMLRKKRPCELHVFAKGGHGFGMRKTKQRVAGWPEMAGDWIQETVKNK